MYMVRTEKTKKKSSAGDAKLNVELMQSSAEDFDEEVGTEKPKKPKKPSKIKEFFARNQLFTIMLVCVIITLVISIGANANRLGDDDRLKVDPNATQTPTISPTPKPTTSPTTPAPTLTPTTPAPTLTPTKSPTTKQPTITPTGIPTSAPTNNPTALETLLRLE